MVQALTSSIATRYIPPVSGIPTVPCRIRATWKCRWVGASSPRGAAVKAAENSPSRAESARTSDTRCLQTASGASRPVMTAPPATTVRVIWLLCPDSTRAATSTSSWSGFDMRSDFSQCLRSAQTEATVRHAGSICAVEGCAGRTGPSSPGCPAPRTRDVEEETTGRVERPGRGAHSAQAPRRRHAPYRRRGERARAGKSRGGSGVFTGIEEVDWASMKHAYGPADDVPGLLYGLASADPAERESALDGMYGAVHHQGNVYACTLACIPFLFELAADPGVRDRGGIVELLTSIGGIDLDEDEEVDELDEDEIEGVANYAMASAAVSAGSPVFFELVADEDPGVRLAAPLALATLHSRPGAVLTLLRERLPVEPDDEVRLALVEAAGRIALRHGRLSGRAADWLSRLAAEAYPPGLRLAALAQLARCAPEALPGDVVRVVSGLLRQLRAGTARPEPAGDPPSGDETATDRAAAPTLVGQLRELSAEESAARGTPWATDLLRTLHVGLDDRVADRTALLSDQLRSPDPWQRVDAVRMSSGLMRAWRGSYEDLVRLIGAQLADPEPRLAEAASYALEDLFGLAAPAGDALAVRVAADPGAWIKEWPSGPPGLGSSVKALAGLGDARVLPALAAALERPEVPHDVGFAIRCLG